MKEQGGKEQGGKEQGGNERVGKELCLHPSQTSKLLHFWVGIGGGWRE
jgi:hypothetical protein